MSKLVAALKKEHETLRAHVATIKQQGVMSSESFAELQRLKGALMAHIQHEDRELYPRLEQAAIRDENLKVLMNRFRDEMNEIATEANQFFERYPAPVQSLDFARDVAKIFALLSNRIITEESALYPRLDELE